MKAFIHHFLYELKAGIRDRAQLFMNWLFPLAVFVMMAVLMGAVNPGFKAQMVPAMSLFGMLSAGLLSLPNGWISLREAGVLRSYRINRVPASSVLLAPVLSSMVHMAGVSALIVFLGIKVFGGAPPADWSAFCAGWLATAISVCGFGMTIGTLMPNTRASMLVSQLFYLPSIMLGGLMFPASILPGPLAAASRFLPARWAMEAMTAVWKAGDRPWLAPLVLAATGIAGLLVSLALFEWNNSPTRKAGWKALGLALLAPAAAGALFLMAGS